MNIDPITIILFLIFFVLPIVNNFLRRGQGGKQGQQGRRQGRPQQPPQRRGRSDDRGTTADTGRDSGGAGDDFTRRLEEARRRVQEAMNGGGDSSSPRQSEQRERPSSSDLFPSLDEKQPARGQQGGPDQPRAPFGGLGREGVSRQRPASQQGTMTKQSSVDRTELGAAPPLRVQRLKPRKSSKIDRQRGILEFDRRSVMQGIIWREILDEPLAKRRRKLRR